MIIVKWSLYMMSIRFFIFNIVVTVVLLQGLSSSLVSNECVPMMIRRDNVLFNRTFEEYKHGFGNCSVESCWIGLLNLSRMTGRYNKRIIRIEIKKNEAQISSFFLCRKFYVGLEDEGFYLFFELWDDWMCRDFVGDKQSFLEVFGTFHGSKFSTFNHGTEHQKNCSKINGGGGWWFPEGKCDRASLTGKYFTEDDFPVPLGTGIFWESLIPKTESAYFVRIDVCDLYGIVQKRIEKDNPQAFAEVEWSKGQYCDEYVLEDRTYQSFIDYGTVHCQNLNISSDCLLSAGLDLKKNVFLVETKDGSEYWLYDRRNYAAASCAQTPNTLEFEGFSSYHFLDSSYPCNYLPGRGNCTYNLKLDLLKFNISGKLLNISDSEVICVPPLSVDNSAYYLYTIQCKFVCPQGCSQHGECFGVEGCYCEPGYSSVRCDDISCFGYIASDEENACSSHGQCVGPNNCSCSEGYVGDNCGVMDHSSNPYGKCSWPLDGLKLLFSFDNSFEEIYFSGLKSPQPVKGLWGEEKFPQFLKTEKGEFAQFGMFLNFTGSGDHVVMELKSSTDEYLGDALGLTSSPIGVSFWMKASTEINRSHWKYNMDVISMDGEGSRRNWCVNWFCDYTIPHIPYWRTPEEGRCPIRPHARYKEEYEYSYLGTNETFPVGEWIHVVLTSEVFEENGTQIIELYVNASKTHLDVLGFRVEDAFFPYDSFLRIGGGRRGYRDKNDFTEDRYDDHMYFSGGISCIHIYDRKLTNQEIINLHKDGCSCFTNYSFCFGIHHSEENVCSGRGTCIDDDTCVCYEKFTGNFCNLTTCNGTRSDNDSACSTRGECVSFNNCSCEGNYTGDLCDIFACFGITSNDDDSCSGHGKCVSVDLCECEKEYSSYNCGNWSCFGTYIFSSSKTAVCGGHGKCVEHDKCHCDSSQYAGDNCDEYTCFNISRSERGKVCDGRGYCEDIDVCQCYPGYETIGDDNVMICSFWRCGPILFDQENVCSSRGICESPEHCVCENDYEGVNCETWSCGLKYDEIGLTCSGHGECISPKKCVCQPGYAGSLCATNYLLDYIVFPTAGVVLLLLVVCLCCVICCVLGCLMFLVFGALFGFIFMFGIVIRQEKGISNFKRLKDFDILLQEQLIEEEEIESAKLKIDRKMFKIRYEDVKILGLLGEGGSGSIVFKARWQGIIVAFKVFKINVSSSQSVYELFEKEVGILCVVNHPSIIQFYGASLKKPRIGIVMEYCPNGEVFEFISNFKVENENKSYPEEEKVRMLTEIVSGMVYLHARSIIHRDLKSENVLVDEHSHCKILDFGLSRFSETTGSKTRRVGTGYYIAPEIMKEDGNYDTKCDVYSFSILLWIIVSDDCYPYGKDVVNVEFKVSMNPNYRPSIERFAEKIGDHRRYGFLVELVGRCWSEKPSERPSFKEIHDLLEKSSEKL